MTTLQLGFLASHRGSTLQAIVDACKTGRLDAEPRVVIGNNSGAYALERARREGLPTYHLSARTHPEPDDLDRAMLRVLREHGVTLVLLTGYLKRLGPRVVEAYRGAILNIHPALLPRHGGQGMYGRLVHEAVLAVGDRETGVTIHLVDEDYDHGPVVAQTCVPVLPGDTPDRLAARVLAREHDFYIETLQRISRGDLRLDLVP